MKIIITVFITTLLMLPNVTSFAETKEDCSKYSTKTLVGQYDKYRCEKGKPPRKKLELGKKLKKLNPFKKKN